MDDSVWGDRGDVLRELEALYTCACLLQGNWPKGSGAEVAFLPGLAVDNWQENEVDDGILETAAALQPIFVRRIAIPGNEGTFREGASGPRSETGYPGGSVWKAELSKLQVPESAVVLYAEGNCGPDGLSWNTRSESDDFLRVACERVWTRAVVVTTPSHILRVLLTLVKALIDREQKMQLFSVTPRSVSWEKRAYHSQGIQQLPRVEHIGEEWRRIAPYRENGSLCSFQELADFLRAQ